LDLAEANQYPFIKLKHSEPVEEDSSDNTGFKVNQIA